MECKAFIAATHVKQSASSSQQLCSNPKAFGRARLYHSSKAAQQTCNVQVHHDISNISNQPQQLQRSA
jgi:hypothetical protein